MNIRNGGIAAKPWMMKKTKVVKILLLALLLPLFPLLLLTFWYFRFHRSSSLPSSSPLLAPSNWNELQLRLVFQTKLYAFSIELFTGTRCWHFSNNFCLILCWIFLFQWFFTIIFEYSTLLLPSTFGILFTLSEDGS